MNKLHKSISTLILLVLTSSMGCKPAFDAKEKIDCGNGNITFVYKNPEKFFPEYVKDYDFSVAMNQRLIKELGNISISFKDSVVRMMSELDQENSRFRMSLKAAFVDVNMHPCSNEAENNFRALSTHFTDFNFRINEINKDVAEAKVILSTPDVKKLTRYY